MQAKTLRVSFAGQVTVQSGLSVTLRPNSSGQTLKVLAVSAWVQLAGLCFYHHKPVALGERSGSRNHGSPLYCLSLAEGILLFFKCRRILDRISWSFLSIKQHEIL